MTTEAPRPACKMGFRDDYGWMAKATPDDVLPGAFPACSLCRDSFGDVWQYDEIVITRGGYNSRCAHVPAHAVDEIEDADQR